LVKWNLERKKEILEENLLNITKYSGNLSYLEIQLQTLKTNLYNYQERWKLIEKKVKNLGGTTDSDFLENFSNIAIQKYQVQIDIDIAIFAPGLRVKEKLIDTIRGIVEIEQVETNQRIEENNTRFQNGVAVVGVGLASASIAGSAISPFIESITGLPSKNLTDNSPLLTNALVNFAAIMGVSIIVGFIFSLFTTYSLALYSWLRRAHLANPRDKA
jgi:hypothetical protein